jgi:hypothetical protein
MARPRELVSGNCYFMISYVDEDLLFPRVTTLRYLGVDASQPERLWRFEFWEVERDEEKRGSIMVFRDSQLWQILDLSGLLRKLKELAYLHPLKALPPHGALIEPDDAALESIGPEIGKLIADSTHNSVTITIQFTDYGFTIGRGKGGGMHATFFTRPLLDSMEEEKIIAFFMKLGATAQVDYRANKGRTRVLEFPLPDDIVAIEKICRYLLTEIYSMQCDDMLIYSWLSAKE